MPTAVVTQDNFELFLGVVDRTDKLYVLDFGLGVTARSVPVGAAKVLRVRRLHLWKRWPRSGEYKALMKLWIVAHYVALHEAGPINWEAVHS